MKQFLRKILFGDIPVREYSTVTISEDIIEKVYLGSDNLRIDISDNHWLLSLDPVVFGIWLPENTSIDWLGKKHGYTMYFEDSERNPQTEAILRLDCIDKIEEHDGVLLLLQLAKARIHHINFIKTRLLFHRYYEKPEQDFHTLKSYSAAYSYPRKVRIVSFREKDYYNMFPMDLVGDIPFNKWFVFGLRHSNATLQRIIETKKIAVSEVPYTYKDLIYQLGKHHRNPLVSGSLPFGLLHSETFDFPIPEWANSYKEVSIRKTRNLGSHMLLWGEEINEKSLSSPHGHLFHVHFLHYLHQLKKGKDYPLV